MWHFIKHKISKSVALSMVFLLTPLLSAKLMTAIVVAFKATAGHAGEENVSLLPSDLIQSTPLEREAWLSCFIIES